MTISPIVEDAFRVSHYTYASHLARAWHGNIAASLTDYRDPASIPQDARAYALAGYNAGFIVSAHGELIGLYSSARGLGDTLVMEAKRLGATHLDCFDGYLPGLYARHGFTETHREPNWTPGGADVVYMALPAVERAS